MLQVFLLDATTTFFGLIVFCQLFQLLSYLSLENFRREYLILCHLVQCDVAVTLYIGGGEGTLFMSCNVSCFSRFPKEGRLSNFFFKKAPKVDHSHRLVSEVIFLQSHVNFFSALSDWFFFLFLLSEHPVVSPYKLQTCIYLFNDKKIGDVAKLDSPHCLVKYLLLYVDLHLFKGYFMYIEASSPRKREDNAKLYSPPLAFPGHMCLEFYYHMSGAAIGSLKVTINEKVVFSRSGDREDKWYKASINVSAIVGWHRVISFIFLPLLI